MKRTVALLYVVVLVVSLLTGCNAVSSVPEKEEHTESVFEPLAEMEVLSETPSPTDNQNTQEEVSVGSTDPTDTEETVPHPDNTPELQITVLDVGQGLSVLMGSNGEYVLYDGGGRQHSSYVVSYLKHHDVGRLQYLFASHYDEDHIAGLIGALRTIPVNEAIVPNYQADTSIYESFMSAVDEAEKVTFAEAGTEYCFGDATLTVLYAADGSEETENDKSTVVSVTMGDFSCIITGDAEYGTEGKLTQSGVPLDCDVYIVGHHGSSSSSSPAFVSAMSPETSIISVGAGNDYGHPTEKTLQVLADNGSAVYRTDLSGEIYVTSDGRDYTVTSEEETDSDVRQLEEVTYVLNNSSRKFHSPDCEAISKIADYNKEYSYDSREELIEQGYDPCGWCNP